MYNFASKLIARMKGKFEDDWHHLRANLLSISGKMRLKYNEILEPHGLTHQQYNALRILRGQLKLQKENRALSSFSTQDLRNALVDKSADSSRLVDRLVLKGLVSKMPCNEDTRRINIVISEQGLALLHILDVELRQISIDLQHISEAQVKLLNELLDAIDEKF
jgi:DNA-binding MarR family transcriptional regulator